MIIIKLGGSVITEKNKPCTFKQKTMDGLSKMIKKSEGEHVLVHGAGSFGHITAKEYDLNQGYSRYDQIKGFSVTHAQVQQLNSMVLESLQKNDIPAVSISPHSIVRLDNHHMQQIDIDIFESYLKKGFTPVTYGDVVLDKKLGFSICSGDLLINSLAEYFKPEKVVFIIDEDGLYSSNPKKDKKAKLLEDISLYDIEKISTTLDDHADVTRGMAGKIDNIKNILELDIDVVLVNGNKQDRVYHVLSGKKTKCTLIHGGKK